MITNDGKLWTKQFLPGGRRALASSLVVGVGSATETPTDTRLQFEIARVPVDLVAYDYVNNLIVFKATLDEGLVGQIYEIGLFTQPVNTVAGGRSSRTLTTFDSNTETWTNAAWDAVNARVGIDSLKHTPSASGSVTSQQDVAWDLSSYFGSDKFIFAYNVENSNTSALRFRFLTNSTNYYDFNLGAQTTGYKVTEVTKASASTTGSPDWSTISQIQITTTSGGGGSSSIEFDGVRAEDLNSLNPEFIMLARKTVTPVVKELGIAMDIEYGVPIVI